MDWLQSILSDAAIQQLLAEKLAPQQVGAYRFSTVQSDGTHASLVQLGESTAEALYLERAERLRHEVLRFEAAGQFEVRDRYLALGMLESMQLASHAVYNDEQLQYVLQRLTHFPMENVSLRTWHTVLHAGLALQSEVRRADFLLGIAGQLPTQAAPLYRAVAATIRSEEHRTGVLNAMHLKQAVAEGWCHELAFPSQARGWKTPAMYLRKGESRWHVCSSRLYCPLRY